MAIASKRKRRLEATRLLESALVALGSFRRIQAETGISRATLRCWYEGKQIPNHGALARLREKIKVLNQLCRQTLSSNPNLVQNSEKMHAKTDGVQQEFNRK
jgi:hypothetical protein